ncbi:MAG: hypothetical protein HFK04_06225 [Oscillospiraceae bacterium]|nr:hypothetical protein [Oscillospiraceae bacterium]
MTKSENLIFSITGPIRVDIRPLAYAVEVTADLLFHNHIHIDDIRVMEDIYSRVAKAFHSNPHSIARKIARISHLVWDAFTEDTMEIYLGKRLYIFDSPKELLIYLAYYYEYSEPFYKVLSYSF